MESSAQMALTECSFRAVDASVSGEERTRFERDCRERLTPEIDEQKRSMLRAEREMTSIFRALQGQGGSLLQEQRAWAQSRAARCASELRGGGEYRLEYRFARCLEAETRKRTLALQGTDGQSPVTVARQDKATAPASTAPGTVTAWVRVGAENEKMSFGGTKTVRYGDGLRWLTKTMTGGGSCSLAAFGGPDPAFGTAKFCEVQITAPAVAQVDGAMPVINKALTPPPAISYSGPRVRTLSAAELKVGVYQPTPTKIGAFREPCRFSHMNFDDPIVAPGQPGVSHLHNFQGNDRADAASTADSLMNSGGSSCAGGTLNRTAYWMPALVDTRTGQPLVPTETVFYYKLGYLGVKAGTVQPFPKGLRMIAGNSKSIAPISNEQLWRIGLECVSGGGHKTSIPSCAVGDELNLAIIFPQCWDGKNLDSPDHKSHMAYATGKGCPGTHPVPLPEIALNTHYKISEPNSGAFLKLSSDNYAGPGGYSLHAD